VASAPGPVEDPTGGRRKEGAQQRRLDSEDLGAVADSDVPASLLAGGELEESRRLGAVNTSTTVTSTMTANPDFNATTQTVTTTITFYTTSAPNISNVPDSDDSVNSTTTTYTNTTVTSTTSTTNTTTSTSTTSTTLTSTTTWTTSTTTTSTTSSVSSTTSTSKTTTTTTLTTDASFVPNSCGPVPSTELGGEGYCPDSSTTNICEAVADTSKRDRTCKEWCKAQRAGPLGGFMSCIEGWDQANCSRDEDSDASGDGCEVESDTQLCRCDASSFMSKIAHEEFELLALLPEGLSVANVSRNTYGAFIVVARVNVEQAVDGVVSIPLMDYSNQANGSTANGSVTGGMSSYDSGAAIVLPVSVITKYSGLGDSAGTVVVVATVLDESPMVASSS